MSWPSIMDSTANGTSKVTSSARLKAWASTVLLPVTEVLAQSLRTLCSSITLGVFCGADQLSDLRLHASRPRLFTKFIGAEVIGHSACDYPQPEDAFHLRLGRKTSSVKLLHHLLNTRFHSASKGCGFSRSLVIKISMTCFLKQLYHLLYVFRIH